MKKKRFSGVLLSLALALALLSGLSAAAYANEPPHTHTIGEETITFVPWTDELATQQYYDDKTAANNLPVETGNYYLTTDVTISETWWPASGVTNLCLNGHSITKETDDSWPVIFVDEGRTLNLFDKEGDLGMITHAEDCEGTGVDMWSGTFNMYGGSISGNTATDGATAGGVRLQYDSTFNMYGGKITGNSGASGGVRIGAEYSEDPDSTFNMYGGEISDNTAAYAGGGVCIVYGGVFNMTGGEISDNTAAEYGGGVYSAGGGYEGSAFNMSSGKVSGNTAGEAGGGVYFIDYDGSFTLTGGEISGNVVTNTSTNDYDTLPDAGGGVFLNQGAFNLSDAPTISGNKLGEGNDAVDNNVYLCTENDTKITLADELTSTTPIGITVTPPAEDEDARDFTSGWNEKMGTAAYADFFKSDDPGYTVVKVGDELQLAILTNFKFTISPTTNGSVTATALQDGNPVIVESGARIQNGTEVTLAVSPASGYVLKDIYYVEGNDTEKKRPTATADPNVFTIEMPQADVTVTASFSTPVTYLDSNGDSQTCANYENVQNSLAAVEWGTEGSDSWYVVSDTTTIGGEVTLNGDVHLILKDGANLTVNDRISGNGAFTIYAQSNGGNMGSLTAYNCIEDTEVTINGGNVTASSEDSAGIWASNDSYGGSGVTINGGVVTASTTSYGGCAIYANYAPTINENLVVKAGDDEASAAVVTDYTTENYFKNYKWVQIAPPHTHNFISYTASGATITATCDNADGKCPLTNHQATLTISAPTGQITYDGSAKAAVITDSDGIRGEAKVMYEKKTGESYGTATETAPTDAGTYKASITLGEATASVEYSIVAFYPVWVRGVQVTSANASNVLGDGKVSYTPADTTTNPVTPAKLTLNDAAITSTGSENSHENAAIYADEDLTIDATGTSTVTGPAVTGNSYGIRANSNYSLTFTGSGTLTGTGGEASGADSDSYGVYAYYGDVTVNGTLDATGGKATDESCGVYADQGAVNVNGKLTSTGGAADYSYGVNAKGGAVTVSANGKLDATGSAAHFSYGVYTSSGAVTVNGTLNAEGGETEYDSGSSNGVSANSVIVSANGKLDATGGTATGITGRSCGVYTSPGDVTVNGTLDATGGASKYASYGVYANSGDVTVNGTLDATGGASKYESYGVFTYVSAGTVTVTANSALTAAGGTRAIKGSVINAIKGTGWTNTAGTGAAVTIDANPEGQTIPDTYKKVQFPGHDHSFTYTASGATITATCGEAGCFLPPSTQGGSDHVATLTISAEGGTYDGTTAYFATTTDLYVIQGDAKVQYQKKTGESYGTATETAPKDAGEYKASITVGGATASVEYTIAQADPTANAPTGLTATYGQTLADVSLEGKNPEGNTPGTWEWADSTQSVGNVVDPAATFKATFTPTSSNYKTVENVDVTVTVGKADAVAATVTANTLTYTGSAQPLVTVTGEATGGTMQYALGTATEATGTYSADIPTATDARTYYIWYQLVGDENHSDIDAACVTSTIRAPISAKVTFKVVGGSWDDGEGDAATDDQEVTLQGYEGDDLKLTADQIPAVGSRPDENYRAGAWDVEPDTATKITADTVYTYSYEAKTEWEPTDQTIGDNDQIEYDSGSLSIDVFGTAGMDNLSSLAMASEQQTAAGSVSLSDIADVSTLSEIVNEAIANTESAGNVENEVTSIGIVLVSEITGQDTSGAVPTITYEVHPEAIAYRGTEAIGSAVITNDQLSPDAVFSFRLGVPDALVIGDGDKHCVKVTHKFSDGTEEQSIEEIKGTAGGYYVALTASSFSEFELEAVSVTVEGRCKVSKSLSLAEEFKINLYVKDIVGDPADYEISYGSTTKKVSEGELVNGKYKFMIGSFSSKQMTNTVNVTIKYGGEVIYTLEDYSIRQYCLNMIGKSSNEKLLALCRATLDYGTCAQQYFDNATSGLANEGGYGAGDDAIDAAVVPEDFKEPEGNRVMADGVTKITSSLNLESRVELNFYFYGYEGTLDDTTVTVSGASGSDVAYEKLNGKVRVTIRNIPSNKLSDWYTVSVGNSSLSYSPMTYAYKHQGDGNALARLCKALYLYATKAHDYFTTT